LVQNLSSRDKMRREAKIAGWTKETIRNSHMSNFLENCKTSFLSYVIWSEVCEGNPAK
jgi:hypothetical protein